jgi:hypothetical protein
VSKTRGFPNVIGRHLSRHKAATKTRCRIYNDDPEAFKNGRYKPPALRPTSCFSLTLITALLLYRDHKTYR